MADPSLHLPIEYRRERLAAEPLAATICVEDENLFDDYEVAKTGFFWKTLSPSRR